jgi:glycerophosphoryl diester phosphodiesterase
VAAPLPAAATKGEAVTAIFAHRGSAHLSRENTVEAFVAARKLGADGIELDVRRTADGVLVVHHDAELTDAGPIAELSSSELPEWIPFLEEGLDACRPIQVNVEIKQDTGDLVNEHDDRLPVEVATLLARREEAARIVVSSFSLSAIDTVRATVRSLATALLVEVAEDPFRALATARRHGHGGVHPFHLSVDKALISDAAAEGIAIRTWTVDDPERIVALAKLGVDAVITNEVQAARRALGRSDGSASRPRPDGSRA